MQKKNKELIKNTVIIFLGKACTQLISFFLLPLYTSTLSSGEYGVVDLVTTYVTLLVPVITLQLEMAIFRFLVDARSNKEDNKKIITNAYTVATLFVLIATFIYIGICTIWSNEYKIYYYAMVVATVYSNLSLQVARGKGDNIGYAIGSIIAGSVTVILNVVLLLWVKMGIEAMFLSVIISNLLCFVFLLIRENILKSIDIKLLGKDKVKKLLKYSIPLVPNGLLWWIINVSDRTIISVIMGTTANGIYAISNKFSTIIIGVYNIFNLSLTESVSLYINDDDRDTYLSELMNKVFRIFAYICIEAITLMFIIFPILINSDYDEAYQYIPVLIVGTLFHILVSMLGTIYVAKKLTKEVAKTSLYAGILNIVINLSCIKYIGIHAAALSTAIAFGVMGIYRYIDVQKYVKIKFNKRMVIEIIALFVISTIIYYIDNLVISLIGAILINIYLFIANKELIFQMINELKMKFLSKKKEIN